MALTFSGGLDLQKSRKASLNRITALPTPRYITLDCSGDKNAAFNNKLYPEKRAKLAEYENVETESLFVPICTRNVFFKHYSPNSTNPLLWDEQAGIEYVNAIVKVVASYLDLQAIEPSNKNEFKYGVWC